jgi:outer membrane protein insertion porin family
MSQKSFLFSFFLLHLFFLFAPDLKAQLASDEIDLGTLDIANPKSYELAGITVTGARFLDNDALISLSGLAVGDQLLVPGEKITKCIENLWKQGLFSDIRISVKQIKGSKIYLEFVLQERARVSKFTFKGIKKGDIDKLREKIKLVKGQVITDNLIRNAEKIIKKYYIDKGYFNVEVAFRQEKDTSLSNGEILFVTIDKKNRVKIHEILFHGNKALSSKQLKHLMKDTKEKHFYNIFSSSKFLVENFVKDKQKIIEKYNSMGYRDAKIVRDTVYRFDEKTISLEITVDEGRKYFFRNISWTGNAKHTTAELSAILSIKRGDIFDQTILDSHLFMNPSGRDVTSLYMDDGYLFFQVTPVEVLADGDSIDLEIRIYEGKQAIINKVTVVGNTKTNDRVIMREIRTKPGQLFSRSDIIRSQRELVQLGYFNQEKMGVNPKPNPAEGTVDIEYTVEEKPSDQIELSGGYGAGRLVGTLGVSFNNFSARNVGNKNAWRPLPSGDGQRLSLRAQSNGLAYQSYNASFTEPWLGGKKPNSFSTTIFHSIQSNGRPSDDPYLQSIKITGMSVGLGKRLTFPDDYFTLYQEVSFQNYHLNNYSSTFLFSNGFANNFSLKETISRNSIDAPIYPRYGSQISLTLQLTPPYSLFENKDYTKISDQEKYKFVEYHKWRFNASWFTKIVGNLVFNTKAQFGFLGSYNPAVGQSPFERFYVGGSGLSGYQLDGRELIALRGYNDNSLTPRGGSAGGYIGGTIFDKFTFELRYPISLNPQATIFLLTFAEAGNAWLKFKDFNPYGIKRSVGGGVRVFLPMFGLLGLDYGYGFDEIPGAPGANKGQFHFSIGQQF